MMIVKNKNLDEKGGEDMKEKQYIGKVEALEICLANGHN